MTAILPSARGEHGAREQTQRPHKAAEQTIVTLSLVGCGLMDPRALALVLLVATSDFLISTRLAAASGRATRRGFLLTSVAVDIGLLVAWRGAGEASALGVAMPIGLSFFTLRSLGHVIDVHRRTANPCATWFRYLGFLCFFPAFLAGPIARGRQLLPQLQSGISFRWSFVVEGASIFVQGLAKKMLLADRLATIVDPVFASPELYQPWATAAAIVAYSLQIYCDFSGYTDMAVGGARMIGVDLPRNFEMPYLAANISEFWRRWHITLSTWLRDYVFLPVAYVGSRWTDRVGLSGRRGELFNYGLASIVTMLLAGFWHGAGWGYVLWGGAHGVALATHRMWRQKGRTRERHLPNWLGCSLTFVFVSLAWVPFRAPNLGAAAAVYGSLLGLGDQQRYLWFPSWLPVCLAAVALGHVATLWLTGRADGSERSGPARVLNAMGFEAQDYQQAGTYLVPRRVTVLGTWAVLLAMFSVALFSPPKLGPFVYGRF